MFSEAEPGSAKEKLARLAIQLISFSVLDADRMLLFGQIVHEKGMDPRSKVVLGMLAICIHRNADPDNFSDSRRRFRIVMHRAQKVLT
jgi:hypothetical protein